MLEGVDKGWIENGARNFVNYSNVSGGDYTFKVRATDRKGNWSGEYASIKIMIIPPIWKRWWFYLLCATLVSAGVYLFYRYRINELMKRQAIRIRLPRISMTILALPSAAFPVYSQVAKIQQEKGNYKALNDVVQKIGNTSTEMISEMNDIVWTINPRNDSMEKILQRMESFAQAIVTNKKYCFCF
jgi:hypothetical protein